SGWLVPENDAQALAARLAEFSRIDHDTLESVITRAREKVAQEPKSLFKMIKNTFETTPDYVLSAYKDNAAVMEGSAVGRYFAD
ncbi:hypothetical protein ONQ60_27580, partial [Salmonella enterica subsp. enterica serovar Virginia]|nr:hypothetical protein [Salmonella enterica subsp. enterica serovar Virginia]